jgi:hypothetical protein
MTVRHIVCALSVAALAIISAPLAAQPDVGGGTSCTVQATSFSGDAGSAQYRLAMPCLDSLRMALVNQQFDRALRIFFGQTYNPRMANWVVFIDHDGKVHQAVMQRGHANNLLRSEKYIYATVFLDQPPARVPTSMDWPTLELSRRSMDYSKESFTTFMVTSFGAGRLPGSFEPVRTVMDLDRPVKLRRIADDTTRSLWFGSARLEIGENTDVQLGMQAVNGEALPGTLSRVTTTINNAKSGRMEFGISIGSSFGPKIVSDDASGTNVQLGAQSNVYVTSYINLVRHHLPRIHRSFGLVFGTNIARGQILDEAITGIGFGRLLGDAGVVIGTVWQQVHTTMMDSVTLRQRTETKRTPRLYLGFDVRM